MKRIGIKKTTGKFRDPFKQREQGNIEDVEDTQQLTEYTTPPVATMKVNGTLRYILNRWIPVTVEVK